MEFNQILADLKKKVFHPVYFLSGEEPYFIDVISDYIEKNVLDEGEKEFNQSVLYGRDVDVLTIIGHAKRFPMMSNHQVIIVKEAQNIKNLLTTEKSSKEDKSPLLTYIENPQRSTVLVFCYKYKTIDKRTSIAKQLTKHAVILESKKLYENQVPDWINGYLKSKEYIIAPKASMLLTEYLGTDLSKISNELDKLMINLPAKSEITGEAIQNNIGISKEYNTFELQNAIGKKNVLKANQIIQYFSSTPKDHPLTASIISLYNYFCKLLIYHQLSDKSKNNVAAALGVHPFFVGDYERAAKNFSLSKLKSIFYELRDYDLKSKGFENATASEGDLLKELMFKILH